MSDYIKGFFINDKYPVTEWQLKPELILKYVEELMKKYNITPDRMVADRSTLKWLFLQEQKINLVNED